MSEPFSCIDRLVPLLDLREAACYQHGHHHDASHLPFADLILRRHELPLPGAHLQLCHSDAGELAQARAMLEQWGYLVTACWLVDAPMLQKWQQQERYCTGTSSRRLWLPSATLSLAVERFAAPLQQPAPALDLACGSGRDALYLAEQGFHVLAVDYKADALERLQISAHALALRIDSRCLDLEQPSIAFSERFALISVARYLHRPLLARLAEWLLPQGLLVYETFLRGAEQFGGPRRPAFLLEAGELAQRFAEWTILHDAVVHLNDGRPMQQFIARKPC
jgi:tellurite methyltransferase